MRKMRCIDSIRIKMHAGRINKKAIGIAAAVMAGLFVLTGVNLVFDEKETIRQAAAGQTGPESSADTEKPLTDPKAETPLNMLMDGSAEGNYYETVLGNEISRDSIATVTFVDTLDTMAESAWDVSKEQNGTVFAWTKPNPSDDKELDLFIGAEGEIAAENCAGLFEGYVNVETIEFNGSLDTSHVTDMSRMFSGCSSLAQLDISGFDTSRVTRMD